MLRKVCRLMLVEYVSHLYKILVLNEMRVEWVSGIWDPIFIYSKMNLLIHGQTKFFKKRLLFADGWSNLNPYSFQSIQIFISSL